MQFNQLDPFANMVPLHQMGEEIEYQMACEAGFDPEAFYNACIENQEQVLRENANEVIAQLWANINQTFTLFSELLERMRGCRPYRAAAMQVEQLTDNVDVLTGHKENTLAILKELRSHLQNVQVQQKDYQEKLAALQAAMRRKQAHSPFANFICQAGERYRQVMINQSAGIPTPPLIERPSGSAANREINQKEMQFNHQIIGI